MDGTPAIVVVALVGVKRETRWTVVDFFLVWVVVDGTCVTRGLFSSSSSSLSSRRRCGRCCGNVSEEILWLPRIVLVFVLTGLTWLSSSLLLLLVQQMDLDKGRRVVMVVGGGLVVPYSYYLSWCVCFFVVVSVVMVIVVDVVVFGAMTITHSFGRKQQSF